MKSADSAHIFLDESDPGSLGGLTSPVELHMDYQLYNFSREIILLWIQREYAHLPNPNTGSFAINKYSSF